MEIIFDCPFLQAHLTGGHETSDSLKVHPHQATTERNRVRKRVPIGRRKDGFYSFMFVIHTKRQRNINVHVVLLHTRIEWVCNPFFGGFQCCCNGYRMEFSCCIYVFYQLMSSAAVKIL